ncbi:MAG: hypothetical protein AAGJ80_20465, partial [Cyanobacteria bacterium J06553_1]
EPWVAFGGTATMEISPPGADKVPGQTTICQRQNLAQPLSSSFRSSLKVRAPYPISLHSAGSKDRLSNQEMVVMKSPLLPYR